MEPKKSKKADLENKKNTFFLFGLVVTLSLVLFAFEWKSHAKKVDNLGSFQSQEVEEIFIPITREREIKPPPPPPPVAPEIINIVNNDKLIEDELLFEDSEATSETLINIPFFLAQKEEEIEEEEIFTNLIEEPAEFPGGDMALYKFIYDHVEYPRVAQENGIEGRVFIKFVVDEEGNTSNAEVLRPVDSYLDAEALRVINMLPKFRPGKQGGRAVKVYYVSTITFRLE